MTLVFFQELLDGILPRGPAIDRGRGASLWSRFQAENAMPLLTTTIGAYPKPQWLPITDWFRKEQGETVEGGEVTRRMTRALRAPDRETEEAAVKATHLAVKDQVAAGIAIPTDGE